MNWEAVAAIAELAGALGVIASLVYLAVQIRQNTRSAREATWHSASHDIQHFRSLLVQDAEVARIYRDGLRNARSLNEDDRWRFGALMQYLYGHFETLFRTRGQPLFRHQWDYIAYIVGRPGARDWWSKGKQIYSPEFQRFVDNILADSDKDNRLSATDHLG
jgi:hypothetical protein